MMETEASKTLDLTPYRCGWLGKEFYDLYKQLRNKIQSVGWDGSDIWKWTNVDLSEEFNGSGWIKDAGR